MKYKVTITEIHEVLVEARDEDGALDSLCENFQEATDGNHLVSRRSNVETYTGDDPVDFQSN